jgi:hypothetical protein
MLAHSTPAVFRPDWVGNTAEEKVIRWGLETRQHFAEVYRNVGSNAGVTCSPHFEIYRESAGPEACAKSPVVTLSSVFFNSRTHIF